MLRLTDINVNKQRQYRQYGQNAIDNAFKEVIEKGTSVYKAAKLYSIPEQTLRDRVLSKVAIAASKSGPSPLFDQYQEAQLSDHVTFMSSIGYGYTRSEVLFLATDFAISLGLKNPNDKTLSMKWFYGFLGRWPELKVRKPRSLTELRAYATSEAKIDQYFNELGSILTKYDLHERPELIYNVDEKGIQLSQSPPNVVGTASSIELTPEKSSIVTLMGCGNALGNQIPPYFIFKGARMREELLTGSSPGANGTVSETGWSNSKIFERYLKDHFLRYAAGRKEEKILLLYDGHRSHISPDLITWANSKDIILFVLPPHTSHVLQPMDVGCFGPFSKIFRNECHKFQRLNGGSVTKYNTCQLACKSYSASLSPINLRSAFRKCGIHPFNPKGIDVTYLRPSTYAKASKDLQEQQLLDVTDIDVPANDVPAIDVPAIDAHDDHLPSDHADTHDSFFADKLPVIAHKPKRPERRSINKIVGGKAITESDVSDKISVYLEESNKKQKRTRIAKSPTRKSNGKKSKPNKTQMKKSKDISDISPKPGPSGVDKVLISDDELMSEDEIVDDEKCCQCHMFQPLELQRCVSVVFTKWGQCMFEGCNHWVHLKYCCDATVLRRHDIFYCPCHGVPCRLEE